MRFIIQLTVFFIGECLTSLFHRHFLRDFIDPIHNIPEIVKQTEAQVRESKKDTSADVSIDTLKDIKTETTPVIPQLEVKTNLTPSPSSSIKPSTTLTPVINMEPFNPLGEKAKSTTKRRRRRLKKPSSRTQQGSSIPKGPNQQRKDKDQQTSEHGVDVLPLTVENLTLTGLNPASKIEDGKTVLTLETFTLERRVSGLSNNSPRSQPKSIKERDLSMGSDVGLVSPDSEFLLIKSPFSTRARNIDGSSPRSLSRSASYPSLNDFSDWTKVNHADEDSVNGLAMSSLRLSSPQLHQSRGYRKTVEIGMKQSPQNTISSVEIHQALQRLSKLVIQLDECAVLSTVHKELVEQSSSEIIEVLKQIETLVGNYKNNILEGGESREVEYIARILKPSSSLSTDSTYEPTTISISSSSENNKVH